MKQIILIISLISYSFGYWNLDNSYERNSNREDSVTTHFDITYGVYLIDVTSSELSRAIDYKVLEATIGIAKSFGNFHIGVNTKILIDEVYSNLSLESNPLEDSANIDKQDFSLYLNYTLSESSLVNIIYKYYKLEANDKYINFREYDTYFNYTSQALAISYIYTYPFDYNNDIKLFFSLGGVYGNAKVEIYENINGVRDDVSINDSQNALGIKLAMGYNYRYDNYNFKILANWYDYNFGKLDVDSNILNKSIEEATLKEQTYSILFGISRRF